MGTFSKRSATLCVTWKVDTRLVLTMAVSSLARLVALATWEGVSVYNAAEVTMCQVYRHHAVSAGLICYRPLYVFYSQFTARATGCQIQNVKNIVQGERLSRSVYHLFHNNKCELMISNAL